MLHVQLQTRVAALTCARTDVASLQSHARRAGSSVAATLDGAPRVRSTPCVANEAQTAAHDAAVATADAAVSAAAVARATTDKALAARIRSLAHAAVDAADAADHAPSGQAAAKCAAAALALADALPTTDNTEDARAVHTHAQDAMRAVMAYLLFVGQTLYTALRHVQTDLTSHLSNVETVDAVEVRSTVDAIDAHCASLQQLAAAMGGHVGQDHPSDDSGPRAILERLLADVRATLSRARHIATDVARSGAVGAATVARAINDDIHRAEDAMQEAGRTVGMGFGLGMAGLLVLALLLLMPKAKG